jgi:glycosyltransferase involved in cell wall biosynthesis
MLRAARPTPPVLIVLNALRIGGSETKSVRMANALAERGTQVTIAYLNPPEQLLSEISPQVRVLHLQRKGKFSVGALRRLINAIRECETPVVLAVNLYPSLYAALARTWLGRDRFRLLMSVNTTLFQTRGDTRRMPFYRRVLQRADTVIFGAEMQRELWKRHYRIGATSPGKPGAATAVLYNGVDTDRFAAPCAEKNPPLTRPRAEVILNTKYVIGTVGALRPEKAHVDLVAATAALRAKGLDVGTLIVGDGSERARVAAEIERHGLAGFVVLAGATRDVRPHLALMDVFVLTSVSETFSNAALEAMACAVPVVCSRTGGMEELIRHGGGISYPTGDIGELTARLERLLSDDLERARLARAARAAVVEHFGWDRMIDRFVMLASAP